MSLIWMGLKGLSLSEEEKTNIQKYAVSGLILFKRNVKSLAQLLELCREINSLKPRPLIMMDREGGAVDRLCHLPDFPPWPGPAKLLRCPLEEMEKTASFMALEMKALGICLNLAPVVDVPFTNNSLFEGRLWGNTAEKVSKRALTWIRGFSQAGLASCAKHFPGHGGVSEDSHFTLPIDKRYLNTLKNQDLIAFHQAIKHGVEVIMTAHVAYPNVEKESKETGPAKALATLPATLSPFLLKTLLRDSMGFKGLLVSDDMDMKALSQIGLSEMDIMKKAFSAGVDILLKCEPPANLPAFLEKAKTAFKAQPKESQKIKTKQLQKFQQKYSPIQPARSLKYVQRVLSLSHQWHKKIS